MSVLGTRKTVVVGTALSFSVGIICAVLNKIYAREVFETLAITLFTTFYHFAMRLITAYAVTVCRRKGAERDSAPLSLCRTERGFYNLIRVKKWKKYAPTYNKEQFDIHKRDYAELCHNMANAEIGHALIVLLSFAPILLEKRLGGGAAFWITSVFAAAFDLQFVFIQRYNRARVSKIMQKQTDANKR